MTREREYEEEFATRGGRARQTGDLIVKPQEFAYILDETKGQISVIVGPQKMSLAGTDKTVVFNPDTQRFDNASLEQAVQPFASAAKGSYVELQNPANGNNKHPSAGTISSLVPLDFGCKVNLAGPMNFPLWPGQAVSILPGHNLRSNQYLICRVYDDAEASANISAAVIKTATDEESDALKTTQPKHGSDLLPNVEDLVTGQLFIIKGTDVSFFIPPNGIEVLPDTEGKYIRDAVTLEQLEYCILLDENGGKRFERGPKVVFPKPTERFLKRTNDKKRKTRRFRAIELNDISGIYVKVIAAYKDANKEYEEGEELWITGKTQKIYFPRPEHSLIKYDDREIHYAVAVPKGEAKYVLNRETGAISLVRGPAMFLPDPRKEILVRRILDTDQSGTWYPGNSEVMEYNAGLIEAASDDSDGFVTDRQYKNKAKARGGLRGASAKSLGAFGRDEGLENYAIAASAPTFDDTNFNDYDAADGMAGETLSRKSTFTRPMSVSIDTKFDGAVIVKPWTGYAVQIVDGEGNRRVVQGPTVVQLQYDEELETFALSTGKQKSADHILRDVYLRVLNNRVSDTVQVETKDMVRVEIAVSYQVNFEGDPRLWFNVENYVQHLADNTRSILRNVAKQHDIQSFYEGYIDIVRNTIVPTGDGERPGRLFEENGMRITEVEVLNCTIGDYEIQTMLARAQTEAAQALIELNSGRKRFELDEANATLSKARAELQTTTDAIVQAEERKRLLIREDTALQRHELQVASELRSHERDLASVDFEAERELADQAAIDELEATKATAELERQGALDEVSKAKMERRRVRATQDQAEREAATLDFVNRLEAEAKKAVDESGAVQPGLVEALTALGQASVLEKITKDIAPLAIVKGISVGGAITQLFEGTPFQNTIEKLVSNVEGGNGSAGNFRMRTRDGDDLHG